MRMMMRLVYIKDYIKHKYSSFKQNCSMVKNENVGKH